MTNVANCVLPLSSQGQAKRCHYRNQLSRNTFLFHRNSLLRPSWSPSLWSTFRRQKPGCRRSCVSTQWVPQCCANHYGHDCWGKELRDPFPPQPFLLCEGGVTGSTQMSGTYRCASLGKAGQNPGQRTSVWGREQSPGSVLWMV